MSTKKVWQVGDRVQWIDYENKEARGSIHVGTIAALIMGRREKTRSSYVRANLSPELETYLSHVTVKWDDGEEETLDECNVQPEDSTLEREFRKVVPEVHAKIYEKLDLASKYLAAAAKIAEEYGIPFSSGISELSQNYFPRTFPVKWGGVSKEVMQDVTQTYNEHDSYYGWEHSQVCY